MKNNRIIFISIVVAFLVSSYAWAKQPVYDSAYVVDINNEYIELKEFDVSLVLNKRGLLEIYTVYIEEPEKVTITTGFDSVFIKGVQDGEMSLYSLQVGTAQGKIAFVGTELEHRTESIDDRTYRFKPRDELVPNLYYVSTKKGNWLFELKE